MARRSSRGSSFRANFFVRRPNLELNAPKPFLIPAERGFFRFHVRPSSVRVSWRIDLEGDDASACEIDLPEWGRLLDALDAQIVLSRVGSGISRGFD